MEMSSEAYASFDPTNLDTFKNPLHLPREDGLMGVLDASNAPVHFTAHKESVEILPGKVADLLAYHAERDGKTYVNSTIRVQKGKELAAEFTNDLDEESTVHWHGLHVDWRMDGHPFRPVAPGATYRYTFRVQDRGGTYWYHPHPHGRTAIQTYSGLAGLFLVEDEDEGKLTEALDLRLGETDVPLLIQDKVLDESGNIVYVPGVMRKVILINLTPNPYLEVGTRIYRFRVLNGSNARTYRLAFTKVGEDEFLPYQIIGTDGGLLERPRETSEVFLSPAERMDVLLDLGSFEVGEEVVLRSLPFDPMHSEHEMGGDMEHMDMGHHHHMGHHMGPARLPDGSGFYLLRLVVSERVDYARRVPEILSESSRQDFAGATTRPIMLSMTTEGGANRWLINGLTHERDEYPIVARRGAKEIWEIHNDEKSMPHPMHLHGFRFLVLGRTGSPERVSRLAVDESGRTATDVGFKDTVLVWPGETVKVAIDFSHGFGGEQFYMFHCHILEHENAGMMLNVKVISREA